MVMVSALPPPPSYLLSVQIFNKTGNVDNLAPDTNLLLCYLGKLDSE